MAVLPEPAHILAVEADPGILALYHDLFDEVGSRVTGVATLPSVGQIRRFAPDLLLLDCPAPGCEALGLLAALRRDPGTVLLPVVVLTAAPLAAVQAVLPPDPALRLLPKPFDVDALLAMSSALLDATLAMRPPFDDPAAAGASA
jgi:CheY-like chemotaxis protein